MRVGLQIQSGSLMPAYEPVPVTMTAESWSAIKNELPGARVGPKSSPHDPVTSAAVPREGGSASAEQAARVHMSSIQGRFILCSTGFPQRRSPVTMLTWLVFLRMTNG